MKKTVFIATLLFAATLMFEKAAGIIALYASAFIDPVAGVGFGVLASYQKLWDYLESKNFPCSTSWLRNGFVFASVGLVSQGLMRSWQYILTGMAPTDAESPLWVFKDVGEWFMLIFYMCIAVSLYKGRNKIK